VTTRPLTPRERVDLTREVLEILSTWEVTPALQPLLLGLPPSTRPRDLNRFRLSGALPEQDHVYERVALLMEIDNVLQKLFPHSPASGGLWITTPGPRLGGATPLEIMLERGLDGIRLVLDLLYNRVGL
jgi:hypothetical protein